MKKMIGWVPLFMGILLFAFSSVRAEWILDGGVLNLDGNMSALAPDIAGSSGTTSAPYTVWSEYDGTAFQIYAEKFETGAWQYLGGSINIVNTSNASAPGIAVETDTPYVTWVEANGLLVKQVYVKAYVSGSWNSIGGSLNFDGNEQAAAPDIGLAGITPYVCWQETSVSSNQIFVKHYNGTDWKQDGGSLNVDSNQNAFAPRIAVYSGVPYVTWFEQSISTSTTQIYVKVLNGSFWDPVGSNSLNMDVNQDAKNPCIAVEAATPYVAWQEYNGLNWQIFVKHYTGSDWVADGGSLNEGTADAVNPSLALSTGIPYVTWCESNGNTTQVYVKRFNGGVWEQLGGSLNIDPNSGTLDPEIAIIDGTPYVTWVERDGSLIDRIYVKHWKDDTPTFTPTVTFTVTLTLTPTIIMTSTPSPTPASPTMTPTVLNETATFTPTITVTPTKDIGITTFTPTERKKIPDERSPVVIRGNVLKPSTHRPVQIGLFLKRSQRVVVKIYSLRGQLVKTLVDHVVDAGRFETIWEGVNVNGTVVRSGIYIVYIETESFKEKRKMVVIR